MKYARAAIVAMAAAAVLDASPASARESGIASPGCTGCHNGGVQPEVTIAAGAQTVAPGQAIIISVSVSAPNGPVAGFFLESNAKGRFRAIEAGTTASAFGANHTMPRTSSSGVTTFRVEWTAPSQPGGVELRAYGMSGNGDRTPRGDAGGEAFLSFTYGCDGATYYGDLDGDGYGAADRGTTRDCAPPAGFSTLDGDCDENDSTIHPGAAEVCDGRDNDCNGQVDEGLTEGKLCEDKDHDGHGAIGGATHDGCASFPGFAPCDGDCDDADPTRYPGAPETCNLRDDNCDGRVDERVRPQCGTGWCARAADTCGAAPLCVPGAPRSETCNAFDDDCDGAIDNGDPVALCGGPGLACVRGVCVPAPEASGAGGGAPGATSPGAASPGCGCATGTGAPRLMLAGLLMAAWLLALARARQ